VLRHLLLIAALALAWPAAAKAQSLAELAKTNKDKDQKSETITAQELRSAGTSGRGNVSPPRSTPAASEDAEGGEGEGGEGEGGEGEEELTPEQQREQARAAWSERLSAAEAAVPRIEARIAELQQSLANPGVGSVEQRTQRSEQLAAAEADLATARQNITALEREGRQNGYRR
jgi:hypothetical protein